MWWYCTHTETPTTSLNLPALGKHNHVCCQHFHNRYCLVGWLVSELFGGEKGKMSRNATTARSKINDHSSLLGNKIRINLAENEPLFGFVCVGATCKLWKTLNLPTIIPFSPGLPSCSGESVPTAPGLLSTRGRLFCWPCSSFGPLSSFWLSLPLVLSSSFLLGNIFLAARGQGGRPVDEGEKRQRQKELKEASRLKSRSSEGKRTWRWKRDESAPWLQM